MPRVMTMNGDHQSVAAAPLDLSTTTRERGSVAAGSPDRAAQAAPRGRSPGLTAASGGGLHGTAVRAAPGPEPGAMRKRPADNYSLKLPIRKRPIPIELETQARTPAPADNGARVSPAEDADPAFRVVDGNRLGAAPVTLKRVEETGQSADRCPIRLFHPFQYGHYPVCYLTPVSELNPPQPHQADHLLPSITLATHQDEDGDTALHIAVVQGKLAIVCTLINLLRWARRSLDIYNNLRQTPLHLAVITQQADMVGVLLRAGADPTALDRNGQTALHLCCEYNQRQCLSVVLSQSSVPVCLEIRNYEGLSPLHLAVLRGHKDLAQMLLDAGADINAMDIKSGQRPLMHAVESNNADMVHFLIETGCDVNCQSYSGNTALHGACGRGQVDTVRLLLKSGADSSLKNYHNDTPVMVAKNKKIADVLRGRGSKYARVQDQHCTSVSPHGSNFSENGSPSPS